MVERKIIMRDVYIVDAVRTATGKMGGALKSVQPEDLAVVVLKALLERTKLSPELVEEVLLGQTRQCTDAANLARVAALRAGYPESTAATTLMMQCASGMKAVHTAADSIRCGHEDVVVAGGTESLSNAPYYLRNARYGYNVGNAELVDSVTEGQLRSQPVEIYGSFNMGQTAENVAEKYGISREEQDAFALESHIRAKKASDEGRFADEIVPVIVPQKKGEPIIHVKDEQIRESTPEKMANLKPVFRPGGTVTAGNACGRSDGASALLLMSGEKVKELNIKPVAKIIGQGISGIDPKYMGMGPVESSRKALKEAGITVDDLGLIELNEAFAAQSLAVINELGLDRSITNVNGGAIALGHALGSSGSRILTTLVHEMKRRGTKYGLATLCVGGGQGAATVVELCE